jgi:hypothetical protein
MAQRMFELGWLERALRSRAVQITAAGDRGLRDTFGLELERVSP